MNREKTSCCSFVPELVTVSCCGVFLAAPAFVLAAVDYGGGCCCGFMLLLIPLVVVVLVLFFKF